MSEFVHDFSPHEVLNATELMECAAGPATASGFRRVIMLLLRAHFADARNYGPTYQHLACYTWRPDHAGTLDVDFFPRVRHDKRTDDHPSVLVGFGTVALDRIVLGDIHHPADDMASTVFVKQAGAAYSLRFTAKNEGDAYDLAEMVAAVLMALAVPVMLNMGASAVQVQGWGEPKKDSPSPDRYYQVAMNLKITYNFLARLHTESHRVRQITLHAQH